MFPFVISVMAVNLGLLGAECVDAPGSGWAAKNGIENEGEMDQSLPDERDA